MLTIAIIGIVRIARIVSFLDYDNIVTLFNYVNSGI